jgi:DNA invertase Pin-like site-specific DNA recombinase
MRGKLVFHIFERNLIRERTTAGLTAARARGRRGGRPNALTVKQLGIARDLYDKKHPIFAGRSRSPKPRCTALSRLEKETNKAQITFNQQVMPGR